MDGVNTDPNYNAALNSLALPDLVTSEEAEEIQQTAVSLLATDGTMTEDEKAVLANNVQRLLGSETLSAPEKTALSNFLSNVMALGTDQNVSPEELATTNRLNIQTSTDEKAILESLVLMTGIDNDPSIPPEQKVKLKEGLERLAVIIAQKNASGGTPALKAWTPTAVVDALKQLLTEANTGLTGNDLQVMEDNILPHVANSLSALNAASSEPPPENALFETLTTSTNENEVLAALKEQVDVSGLDPEVAEKKLSDLAKAIVERNKDPETQGSGGIESADPQTVEKLLAELLGIDSDTSLSPEMKTALRSVASSLANTIAQNNEAKWTQDSYSVDRNVVQKALVALSNVRYDPSLTDQERVATEDYLKIMSLVLAFMSEMRAKIAQLDGMLQKLESQGKLGNIKDQTTIALKNYEKTMHDIEKMLDKMDKAKQTALILKIVMPIVQAILLVVTVVVVVAISVATMGTATPVAVAILIAMVTLIIGLGAISIALTSSGAIEKMCKAMDVKNPVLKATIGMAVEIVLVAISIVVSLGISAVAMGARAAATVAQKTIEAAIRAAMDAMKEAVLAALKNPAFLMAAGGAILNTAFSSGMVTQVSVALFKACGMKDKDAEMAAMIVTMLLMITMILALLGAGIGIAIRGAGTTGAKAAGTALDAAADEGGGAATTATTKTVTFADDAAEGATSGGSAVASTSAKAGGNVSLEAIDTNTTMFTNLLNNLAKQSRSLMDNKMMGLILNLINNVAVPGAEAAAQILPEVIKLESNVRQAEITKVRIGLTRDLAHGQALIEFLKGVLPSFDVTLEGLQEDSRGQTEFMTDLLKLFKDMVDQATLALDAAHQTA